MNARQEQAWVDHQGFYLLDLPRPTGQLTVDPGYTFDPVAEFGRAAPLIVEVGSGQGDAVVAAAARRPDMDFLALEVYAPGLAQTVLRASRDGVRNIRLAQVDAVAFLNSAMPSQCADEIWVFFPDPWHKLRHRKRRLVNPEFAATVTRILRAPEQGGSGGVLRLATDWAAYGDHMRTVLDAAPGLANSHGADGVAPRFDGRVLTNFERKAAAARRVVVDLEYRRVPARLDQLHAPV